MLSVEDLSCIVTPTASLPASTTIHFIHSQWQGLPSGFTCPSPCVCVLQFNNNKTSITCYNKGGRHPPEQMSVTLHAALFLNHAGVWWMQSLAGFYLLCVNYRNLIYVLYILPTYQLCERLYLSNTSYHACVRIYFCEYQLFDIHFIERILS